MKNNNALLISYENTGGVEPVIRKLEIFNNKKPYEKNLKKATIFE